MLQIVGREEGREYIAESEIGKPQLVEVLHSCVRVVFESEAHEGQGLKEEDDLVVLEALQVQGVARYHYKSGQDLLKREPPFAG